ncbi:14896_t:CDS:2 [Funneliformis geosporum]|nr:14896_t:CDS:2 [Funneliformis geosporum]
MKTKLLAWQGKTKIPRLHIDFRRSLPETNSITSLKAIFKQLRWLHRNDIPAPSIITLCSLIIHPLIPRGFVIHLIIRGLVTATVDTNVDIAFVFDLVKCRVPFLPAKIQNGKKIEIARVQRGLPNFQTIVESLARFPEVLRFKELRAKRR